MPMFLQMAHWWATPEPDESFLQFRERSLRDGAWLTYVVAFVVAGYCLASWDAKPHRAQILVLLGIAVFGGYVISRLPASALVRSRWREPFFLAWTALDFALIALVVASDGGDWSPLRAVFFLPLFFAALSYPPRSVVATGVLAGLAYAGAALLGGHATGETLGVFSAILATAAVMGVSQAVNRERQRGELAALSRSDPLTGALNRRGFTERFEAELSDHVRHDGRPLGLIVIDLDDFKAVNDTRGHAAGDDLLCAVADTLAPTSAPPTCSAASGATSSPCSSPRPARASCAPRRSGSSSGSARSPPRRSASRRCRSTASPPTSCIAPPTPISTAPSSAAPSAASRPWRPSRRRAPARSPSAAPRRCPRRW